MRLLPASLITPARCFWFVSHFSRCGALILNTHSGRRGLSHCRMTALESSLSIEKQISALFNAPDKQNVCSLITTGGGVSISSWLLTVPGASNVIMSSTVPYAFHSLVDTLTTRGIAVDTTSMPSFCSLDMADLMAEGAYREAVQTAIHQHKNFDHGQLPFNIFGVACTAALASVSPKRGNHRCHISLVNGTRSVAYTLTLEKGKRSRVEEDILCSRLILEVILDFCGQFDSVDKPIGETLLSEGDSLTRRAEVSRNLLEEVCNRQRGHAVFFPPHASSPSSSSSITTPTSYSCDIYSWVHAADVKLPKGTLVFPGSFNPVHDGHIDLVLSALQHQRASPPTYEKGAPSSVAAAEASSVPLVVFEIAAVNADKPPISLSILYERIKQFDPVQNPVVRRLREAGVPYAVTITSEPYFTRKAKIFQDCTFVIGADTLERLFNLKYYTPPTSTGVTSAASSAALPNLALFNLIKAMSTIAESRCTFIVGGRVRQNPKPIAPSDTATSAFVTMDEFQTMESIVAEDTVAQTIFQLYPTMFQGISEDAFRSDLSSTIIRQRLQSSATANPTK